MIAVVDYGSGNLRSVAKAFEAIGADVKVTGTPADLALAERIVLPGVGSFAEGMRNLRERGLVPALEREVVANRKPFLGICLGMQMLAEEGSEDGVHRGLGWVPGRVVPMPKSPPTLKVPHMGWNEVSRPAFAPELFARLPTKPTFYFAHSYRFEVADPRFVACLCEYGGEFAAAVLKGNIFAAQFHPEKSQQNGLTLLRNFLSWKPSVAAEGGVSA